MSFLPQNKFASGVFAYAEGVAIFLAGLTIVFGAAILILSAGYLIVAYFQKLLGVTGLDITGSYVVQQAISLMFFGFFAPIEILVGLLAIVWNALGQFVYDIINFIIGLVNAFIIHGILGVLGWSSIGDVTWVVQDTSNWVTIITQIQNNLQAILFPPA